MKLSKSGSFARARKSLDQADLCVRAARVGEARRFLGDIEHPKKLPDALLVRYLGLLRRSGAPMDALKILSPRIRNERFPTKESAPFWIEYADCMTRLNAVSTSLRILSRPELADNPEASLHLAFAHIHAWNYSEAEQALRRYSSLSDPEDYSYWVCRLNLAACLVASSRLDEAIPVLNSMESELQGRGFLRLLYNSLELRIQIGILSGKEREVKEALKSIQRFNLESFGTIDSLLVEKWKAVHLLEHDLKSGLAAIQEVRLQCERKEYSEIARDLDLRGAVARNDQGFFRYLWFGTPFPCFREMIPGSVSGGCEYSVPVVTSGARRAHTVDISPNVEELLSESSPLLGRLFYGLLSDFYRAPGVIELFERVYPQDFFNPLTSPSQIHQLIHRLRAEFESCGVPLRIDPSEGSYLLRTSFPALLRLKEPAWKVIEKDPLRSDLDEIIRRLGTEFSARELADMLSVPLRTAQEQARRFCESGLLSRIGRARSSRYQVVP